MTKDVIALTPNMPDTRSLLVGLFAGGPDLGLTSGSDGAVLHLRTPEGRPLVSVEAPLLVHTPGEAERLLGSDVTPPPLPYWWTETRTATAAPEAEELTRSISGRLTTLLGGTVWPRGPRTTTTVSIPAGSTDPAVPDEQDDLAAAVDVLTDATAVVLADRPVLALTTWLSGILRATAQARRALHLVTPSHVRLTLPLRTALGGAPNRWVVQDPGGNGYYDGLSGVPLTWRNGTFLPTGTSVADAFTRQPVPSEQRQLSLSFRTVHAPDAHLVLGRALEAAWRHLTDAPPAGWGTAEPVNLPWSTQQLTDLARDRAPAPTHLIAVGSPARPAIATQRISRTTAGVAEEVSLTLGYNHAHDIPMDVLAPLAEILVAEHGLTTMLVTVRTARADLTVPALLEGPPFPVSFTLGPRDVRKIGADRAARPPIAASPRRLGLPASPALHYPLGDGTDPEAWTDLQRLEAFLRSGAA